MPKCLHNLAGIKKTHTIWLALKKNTIWLVLKKHNFAGVVKRNDFQETGLEIKALRKWSNDMSTDRCKSTAKALNLVVRVLSRIFSILGCQQPPNPPPAFHPPLLPPLPLPLPPWPPPLPLQLPRRLNSKQKSLLVARWKLYGVVLLRCNVVGCGVIVAYFACLQRTIQ